MIDKNRQYKIRFGKEVRLYALDGIAGAEVHGAFKEEFGWRPWTWDLEGRSVTREDWVCRNLNENYESEFDLVEI